MKTRFIFTKFEELMEKYKDIPKDNYPDGPESILWYGERAKINNANINELYIKVIDEHRWPTDEEISMMDLYRKRLQGYAHDMHKQLGNYLYDDKTFEYVQQVLKEVEKNFFG